MKPGTETGGDSGKGVGEHPPNGDRGIGEGGAELVNQYAAPMYAPTAAADSAAAAGAGQGKNERDQPCGSDDLADEVPGCDRFLVAISIAWRSNMTFASTAPRDAAEGLGQPVGDEMAGR